MFRGFDILTEIYSFNEQEIFTFTITKGGSRESAHAAYITAMECKLKTGTSF